MGKKRDMLTLPIKKQWFDMILSGEKTEEYRSTTPYYRSRFKNLFEMCPYSSIPSGQDKHWIRLRNGYSSSSPSVDVLCSLDIKQGKTEWGAEPGVDYFTLKIHERKNVIQYG